MNAAAPGPASTSSNSWLQIRALPYCLYLLLTGACWTSYSRQLNADGISYLSIASQYAAGHWSTAVNTYWSPLFCWLLAIGIAVKAPPLVFARLLLIAFGLIGLFALQRLLKLFELQPEVAAAANITAVPMFGYFALHDVTPDALVVALLLLYLSLTCGRRMTETQWAYAGAFGAVLYLAKAYCFVFVIAQLLIVAAIRIFAARGTGTKWRIARQCGVALGASLLLSSPWLVLIGKKAGKPTLSAAGAYNLQLAPVGKAGHPMLSQGLFPPPNAYAVSIWEEPDAMRLGASTGRSTSRRSLREGNIIARNAADFARYELSAVPLLPLILLTFAYLIVQRRRSGEPDLSAECLLATYAVYPAGYFLTFIEHRYIWIEDVLALVMAVYILDWLNRQRALARQTLGWIGLTTVISFCCAPLFILVKHRNDLRPISDLVPALRALHMSGNVASNARWDDTQYLAYELALKYYGMPAQNSASANESALIRDRVKYLFVWYSAGSALPKRPGQELFGSKLVDVYELPVN